MIAIRSRSSEARSRRRPLLPAALVALALALAAAEFFRPLAAPAPDPAQAHAFAGGAAPEAIQAACRGDADPEGCYVHALDHVMRAQGMDAALALVDQLAARDPVIRTGAHEYVHELGRLAYYA